MDKNELVGNLLTEHNLTFIFEMIKSLRKAANNKNLDEWVSEF